MYNMPKWLDYSNEEIAANNIIKTKYDYDLKISNIEMYTNKYDDTSILVSKPFKINSLVNNIKLDTDEYIPEGTSIEYYISLAEIPTIDDWIPIASNDNKEIKNERLFFNNNHQGILRFGGAIKNITVKKDGTPIDDSEIILENDINNNNVVYIKNLSYQSIYTIDYTIEQPMVEISEKDLIVKQAVDEFNNLDDQRKLSLSHNALNDSANTIELMIDSVNGIPGFIAYKDKEEVEKCKFRRITLNGSDYLYPNGSITKREDGTYNWPRLKDCSSRLKESFRFSEFNQYLPDDYSENALRSHYPYIEYFIDGNNVYFAENSYLLGNTSMLKFYARYNYIDTPLRFKAILRNNTTHTDITPVLNSYKITLI